MKTIQGADRHQIQFTSLNDMITDDNPVRIIDAFVEKLELAKLGIAQQTTATSKTNTGGAPRFDDQLLFKLYLYGYLNKIRSSRKLEQECQRNVELRWLMQPLTILKVRD
jgi:transposase